jgi:tRNA/rRNA methyltransferase
MDQKLADLISLGLTRPSPVIILVEQQLFENIGMVARAMANFGLGELRLVKPRDGWSVSSTLPKGAHQAASGAVPVLEAAKLFDDVRAATADMNRVYATTARERDQMKQVLTPGEAMPQMAARIATGERVGILFGRERTGLENAEIGMSNAIITFPVNPVFSSLNLAQAVLLIGYEWMKHARNDAVPYTRETDVAPARQATLLSFFDFLDAELDKAGHFPADKRDIMSRNLRDILQRREMSEQDVRSLRGAISALVRRNS